jgi:hypothetical protein
MKSRLDTYIDEALEYMNRSDHKYQTTLIGGALLVFTQYAFIYFTPSNQVERWTVLSLGAVSATVLIGYVMILIRRVSAGDDHPPRFTPITVSHVGSIVFNGLSGFAVVVGIVVAMFRLMNEILRVLQGYLISIEADGQLLITFLIAMNWGTFVYLLFLIPYVIVAFLLLFGQVVLPSVSRVFNRSDIDSATVPASLSTNVKTGFSGLRLLVSKEYAYAWLLALVLLLFNTDVVLFVSNVVLNRQAFDPEFGTGTALSAFFSFYFLISVMYLFTDISSDVTHPAVEEEV